MHRRKAERIYTQIYILSLEKAIDKNGKKHEHTNILKISHVEKRIDKKVLKKSPARIPRISNITQ